MYTAYNVLFNLTIKTRKKKKHKNCLIA